MTNAPREALDDLCDRIASRSSTWSNLTAEDVSKALKDAEACHKWPGIPASPLPRWAFDDACKAYGVEPAAAMEDGKRFGVDAVLGGWGIVFTQKIPIV